MSLPREVGQQCSDSRFSALSTLLSRIYAAPSITLSVNTEHFQPVSVFFGLVLYQLCGFGRPLRLSAVSEIDQARALRAQHIHAQAQHVFCMSLTVHKLAAPALGILLANFRFRVCDGDPRRERSHSASDTQVYLFEWRRLSGGIPGSMWGSLVSSSASRAEMPAPQVEMGWWAVRFTSVSDLRDVSAETQ